LEDSIKIHGAFGGHLILVIMGSIICKRNVGVCENTCKMFAKEGGRNPLGLG
jgi:hypothetical protein